MQHADSGWEGENLLLVLMYVMLEGCNMNNTLVFSYGCSPAGQERLANFSAAGMAYVMAKQVEKGPQVVEGESDLEDSPQLSDE